MSTKALAAALGYIEKNPKSKGGMFSIPPSRQLRRKAMFAQLVTTTKFLSHDVGVYDYEGSNWAPVKQISDALESDPRVFRRLVREMQEREELHEGTHFAMIPVPTGGGPQRTMALSHRGAIRVSMRCDAPKAVEFRDWAEDVLFKVMTQGHYLSPALTQRVDHHESAITALIHEVRELRISQGRMMLAPQDVTHWLSPTERLRQLLYHRGRQPPYGFNQRGHFDGWLAVRYRDEFGSIQTKPRRLPKVTLVAVVEPRPEVDLFLLEMYEKYVSENPAKQERLKLIPGKEEPHVRRSLD